MSKYNRTGSITVFLSFILLVIISITFQVIEEAMHQADRVKALSSMELSLQSVLAEYDTELLEQYGLFFLWGGQEELEKQLDYYLYRNIENTGGMVQMQLEETILQAIELATDDKGKAYYRQAVEAETQWAVTDALKQAEELLENYKQGEENHKTLEENKVSKEQLQIPEDLEVDESAKEQAQNIVNPVEIINAIRENGVAGLVAYNMPLSTAVIDSKHTLQKRTLHQGNYKNETSSNNTQELIFNMYLKNHFSRFESEALNDKNVLEYQQEYIIAGKKSDKENLNEIIEKILWIREGVNFVYLLSDGTKMAQADALAVALVGYTGIAPLVTAMKFAILSAWAYGESLLEVRMLLQGKKIEFSKSSDKWRLSLENLPKVAEILKGDLPGDETGMSYQDYLFLFLGLVSQENRCYRSMDMIEQQMRLKEGKEEFQMDYCVSYIKAEATVESREGRLLTIKKGIGY